MTKSEIIREALNRLDLTQVELSRKVNVAQGTISKWLADEQNPNTTQWDRVEAFLAKNPKTRDLVGGGISRPNIAMRKLTVEKPVHKSKFHHDPDDQLTENIPEIDVRAGAGYGGGSSIEENVVLDGTVVSRDAVRATWGFPFPFLRDELHVKPGRFHVLQIRGDSMVDLLFNGDRVGIDLDDIEITRDGGIFALLDDTGAVIVKQVELVSALDGERKIRCTSRNTHFGPFELQLADPVRIIGRVACRITRL